MPRECRLGSAQQSRTPAREVRTRSSEGSGKGRAVDLERWRSRNSLRRHCCAEYLAENFAPEAMNSASVNSLFHGRNTGSKAKYFAKSAEFPRQHLGSAFGGRSVWSRSFAVKIALPDETEHPTRPQPSRTGQRLTAGGRPDGSCRPVAPARSGWPPKADAQPGCKKAARYSCVARM